MILSMELRYKLLILLANEILQSVAFSFTHWRQDLRASIVVFLVALPLCLGIALASGAPLAAGIIAGIIGGVVVGALTDSPLSVSGPAAGLTVIVLNAITDLGSFEVFGLAVFLSGVLQIVFGFLGGGVIGNFFPRSVIRGLLAAIGIILIIKQVPYALGLGGGALHYGAVIISLVSLGLMVVWEKNSSFGLGSFRFIPGALLAVILSVVLNELFALTGTDLWLEPSQLVQLPFSGLDDLWQGVRTPEFAALSNYKVYLSAFTLALVGSIESLVSVDAADKLDPTPRVSSKNRELLAQGSANALSGLLGGLPITAVIVRTSANATAGARTQLSSILHGLWLFLSVILLARYLNLIPLASLSAILLLVGYKLTRPELYLMVLRRGHRHYVPFAVTIAAILFTDLLFGVIAGLSVAILVAGRRRARLDLTVEGALYRLQLGKDVTFLQRSKLVRILGSIPSGSKLVIASTEGGSSDDDISEVIEDYLRKARALDITVELTRA
jgi:MFS superfamily sulfate permease-like transporter